MCVNNPISDVKTLVQTLHGHRGIEDDDDEDEVGDDRASGWLSKWRRYEPSLR